MQQISAFEFNTGLLLSVAGVLLALGLMAATRRAIAFHAADRNVPAVFSGMATSAAFLSAAPFLGLLGTVFVLGSDGLSWLVGLAAGFVLMGVLIAPSFRASGAVTVPQFLALRYGGRLLPLLATLAVLALSFVLLVAQLTAIGEVASRALQVPELPAIGGAATVIAVVLAAGGMRGGVWLGAGLLVAVLIAYLAPLGVLTLAKHGNAAGPLTYGQTLREVQELEINMISAGLADARSLKPHLRQFLQVDYVNTLALIVCLMAGTAVLPHVLMRTAVTAGVRQTRMAMAWALLFSSAVLVAIPAYAAMTKHEVYSFVAKGVPFSELPEVFAQDGVSVQGVPLTLYRGVVDAMRAADSDAAAVGMYLQDDWPKAYAAWSELKPQVKAALMQSAKGANETDAAQRFETWRSTILPVAATAAGNKTGKLTQNAIAIDPAIASFLGFQLAGLSTGWMILFATGAILAAVATAMATAWAVSQSLGHDLLAAGTSTDRGRTLSIRIATAVTTFAAAALALWEPGQLPAAAAWTFSVAGAVLFPVLVLGIWWKRATRAGAVAGMLAGLAVTIGYAGGSQFAPVTFYAMTGSLSDAGPSAAKKLADLIAVAEKASPEGKSAAEAALLTYTRGTPYKAGIANWLGIHNSAAAVFGLPVGFLVIILVSLLTRRPSAEALQFAEAIRRSPASS